ncbi:PilZ domain-containing protein [Schlegelella sp. S2-27]|uniref:PilZ domain-containing protein n=1 Tax=Caldimonas mangrovi TaxID=2944811 RepID=A0ABT0YHD2_9BURK|nr:PilZ domain-containing protein [Caldimonas mangrovi]MCM5678140.1 PilZ domain-containing protein [Caldimonas mangrovi]
MRQFIRHPVSVPIEVKTDRHEPQRAVHTHDISLGGLAFVADEPQAPGAELGLRIGCVQPPFEARARVVWCRPHAANGSAEAYELGVAFLDPQDVFLARMVEQICYIEDYRREVLRCEGRELTSEEAAFEWIDRYAADFPVQRHMPMH